METKSEKVLKSPVSKVKQTDDVMKTSESKLVKVSSCPQTPEEVYQKRQVNIELCNDTNCPLSMPPMGAGYEAAMRLKVAHASHTKKRKLVEFNSEGGNAAGDSINDVSNSSVVKSEGSKPHSLIILKSEPDESTSPVIDLVSPKKITPKKPEMPVKSENLRLQERAQG